MKNIQIFAFVLVIAVLSACNTSQNDADRSVNTANNSSQGVQPVKDAPKTERSNSDSALTEDGVAKATPAAGRSNIQGQVLYNGKPVEGIDVQLCEKFSQFVSGCGGEKFKTKTDANGEYLLADVTPRTYEGLLVRVFNTDNQIFATEGIGLSSAKYVVEADKTYFARPTNLFKADLKLTEPKTNASVAGTGLVIKWEAYPDAAYYTLSLQPEEYDADSSISGEEVSTNEYAVSKTLKPGKYTIVLRAYNADRVRLSELNQNVKFSVK